MQGYVELEPESWLSSQVVCLWRHTFDGKGPYHHRILPDGCVDIVVMGDSEPMVVGPDTKAALISFDKPTEIIGVRLMPRVAASVLRENVSNLLDQTIPLAEFRGGSAGVLHERLLSLTEWGKKLKLLQAAVFDRPAAADRRVADAVAVVAREPGLNVDGLASTYGLTARHMLRLFETHVGSITALQTEYSLWTRDAEGEILDTCRELGISFVAYSPLGRGFLTGAFTSPQQFTPGDFRSVNPRMKPGSFEQNRAMVAKVEAMAKRKRCTAAQLSLAWVLSRGDTIIPIPGTRREKYLKDNIAATELTLSREELEEFGQPGGAVPRGRHAP